MWLDDVVWGLGEAAPHPHASPSRTAGDAACLRELPAWLAGAGIDQAWAAIDRSDAAAWVKCGMETAVWDAVARAQGRPLAETLGGAARDRVPVNALLEANDPDALIVEARQAHARGHAVAKRKVVSDLDTTVAEVERLRVDVPGLQIRLDVNGTWRWPEAQEACARLASPNVEWIEQPLSPEDDATLPELRAKAPVRIALDESIESLACARRLASACDAMVLKLVQVGGFRAALEIASEMARADGAVAVTTGFDTGVGLTAAVVAASMVPGRLAPCGLATASFLAGDIVRGAPVDCVWMSAPEAAGLGVELDPEALERFAGPP